QYLDLALCDSTLSLIGKAIPNYYFHVLDENKNQVPSGVEGELYVGGTGLARGYLNLEQFSAERFIKDPFSSDPEARLYRSGDLVKSLSDGSLEYIGRIDQQVKIRGYRIELGEIENVLQEHPVVNQAVVLARDDNKGGKQLVSYIVSDGGFTKEDLIAHLNTRLPDHMVPRIFLAVDEIPLTINGKVDKSRLPNPNISDLIRTDFIEAKTSIEKDIVRIWKDILLVDKIGINDNFFELGGNSLLAQNLIAKLSESKIDLPITKLYQF